MSNLKIHGVKAFFPFSTHKVLRNVKKQRIKELCPTQMAYWAKNCVIVLTRAAR